MSNSPANCVFCKIVAGQIPSLRLFETPDVLAFLDVNPLAPGHALLVPKVHCDNILDAPASVIAAMANQLPRLAKAVLRATGATGLNILQNTGPTAGQAVFHLHFHFIPRRADDKLGYRWNAGAYEAGVAEATAARIVNELKD